MKQIHRTKILVEVLSDEPYRLGSIKELAYDITDGDCSGVFEVIEGNVVLTGADAIKACEEQGTDPEFFMLTEEDDEA